MISYLITDPKYYGILESTFIKKLIFSCKNKKVDFACFRDKKNDISDDMYKSFILNCKILKVKSIIHTNIDIAKNFGAFGVHLSSNDFSKISVAKSKKLFVVASTHNIHEANFALFQGADLITLSTIFCSPDKSYPIGLEKLKEITGKIPDKCIALGGILENAQISACQNAGAIGFASIRYFIK